MEILTVDFDDNILLEIYGEKISIHPTRELDPSIVRLGINAPKHVMVNREEVYHAKKKLERLDVDDRVVGKVKRFNSSKGMGFATVDHLDKDILIHYKQFKNKKDSYDVWEDDKITFSIRKTMDGFKGENIELCQ